MAEIRRVYRETMPVVRLIGKKYFDSDRSPLGGFGLKWVEWYEKAYYDSWYFERFVCPRYTEPDEFGKVIMDYCIYLKEGTV